MDTPIALLAGPFGLAFAALWGAIWGSFFNVVIARVPLGLSVVRPASHCFSCGKPVRALDNVPVLSFLWLRGRCRECGVRFSIRYPLVELLTAGLTVALWMKFVSAGGALSTFLFDPGFDAPGSDADLAVRLARFSLYFAFVGALTVLAFIDFDTKRLPDVITIPGIAIFFAGAFAVDDVSWSARLIGVVAGYLFVRVIADFYYYVLKREGLGLGDGKLLAMMGALLGWKCLPFVVFFGSVAGTLVTLPVLYFRRSRKETGDVDIRNVQVPFGPFLVVGAIVYTFAGSPIWAMLMPE